MQATNEQTATTNQWQTTAVTTLTIIIAIILFGFVISRMGLFNRLVSGETAVAPHNIQIQAQAMAFGLPELQVKTGQEVTLILDNLDLYSHSFDVDELDLHVKMPPNGRAQVTFTPTQAGTYTIYCAVPGHQEAGMVSTLLVKQ